MMNLLGLCLVVSSLVAAGVLSPNPSEKKHPQTEEEVIVKEGPRIVVVEYGQEGHLQTKVKISPPDDNELSQMMDTTKQEIKAASSVITNEATTRFPRELVCDALGKCKHKIADAFVKAKNKVSETAHEAKDKVQETVHDVASVKKEMAYEAKEAVQDVAHEAKEYVEDKLEEAKGARVQKARDIREGAKESVEKLKGRVEDVKAAAKQSIEKAKEKAKDVEDAGKTLREHIKGNVTEKAKGTEQAAKHNVFDVLWFMYSKDGLDSFACVVQLLGFSMAYGMCVWVTFVSSYVLAKALARQQFGVVQSKIYPAYFRAMAYSVGLALLGHLLGQRKKLFSNNVQRLQAYSLLASLLMVLANAFYLEPRATKVMFERMKIEKEEGRGRERLAAESSRPAETEAPTQLENPEQKVVRARIERLGERLKKLNSYSSFVNILTLMNLSWHLVYLGQRLHQTS